MSVFNISGEPFYAAYDQQAVNLSNAYDIKKNTLLNDPYIPGRLLLFEDSFMLDEINENNWQYKFGAYSGEIPFFRAKNVTVKNSSLVITAKKEEYLGHQWTAGEIISCGIRAWMFGRFEAKIKFPGEIGSFPAFWCMGYSARESFVKDDGTSDYRGQTDGGVYTQWPVCGEIDITEGIPGNTSKPPCNLWGSDGNSLGSTPFSRSIDTKEWHIYAMEWTPEYIAMFIDDVEYKRWVFSDYNYNIIKAYVTEPMSILVDLTVGSSGGSIPSSATEYKMYVDWVRVYAPENVQQKIEPQEVILPNVLRLKKGYRNFITPKFIPFNTSEHHVTWESENSNIAWADNKCWIYGDNYGTTKIYAIADNEVKGEMIVTVVDEL